MGGRRGKRERIERHRHGLTEQIEDPETQGVRTRPRSKRQKSEEQVENEVLEEKMTAKIMKEAREQNEDLEAEENVMLASARNHSQQGAATLAESDSDDEDGPGNFSDGDSRWGEEEVDISPEDEAAMAAFLNPMAKQRTLADIILEKIQEKQQRQKLTLGEQGGPQVEEPVGGPGLDEKVVAVYKGVGLIMKRFTTGKVPKAFKIIPNLQNWEEVLLLTEPEGWSPHAVYQATRLFVSNLNARMAQRFLALVLLPHVREDIHSNRRLHFALFQAMKKATYKPDAFFKGLLLPLCQSGTCTLREAVIVSSIINRVSIPVVHSAAALLRLADMEYSGTTSFFIRVLLDKKYAMPYRVVDAVVDHFMRFLREDRTLPVVWHQSLLVFIQRYKHEIRKEDQQGLRKLTKTQYHYQVSPEIHRELELARSRGQKATEDVSMRPQAKIGSTNTEDIRNLAPIIFMDED